MSAVRLPLMLPLLAAALLIGVWLTGMPAPAVALSAGDGLPAAVRGVLHVHTRRSDGSGTPQTIGAAAARAGLDFVVVTDHGDGARVPAAPAYHDGVLVIDAVEISTDQGHVLALGMARAPYPLGGEARDVVEDIARLGGVSIAAHPDSPRDTLRWSEWDVPVDGLEWLNADSAWRDERVPHLLRALLTYPVRPVETIASMFDRPAGMLNAWDRLTQRRQVVALAAADAHARVGLRADHAAGRGVALPIPAYEVAFRALSIGLPGVVLSGDAATDAAAVTAAIRRGRIYSAIDGFAAPAAVSFTARSGGQHADAGDQLTLDGPVTLTIATNAPAGAETTLLGNGIVVARTRGPRLEVEMPPARAVYRAEVSLPGPGRGAAPWVVTNPIYAGWSPPEEEESHVALPGVTLPLSWHVEASAGADGAIDIRPQGRIQFRYALGGRAADSPFVAFVTREVAPLASAGGVAFRGFADRPMRVSLQLRSATGARLERWHRSIYLDEHPRDIIVWLEEMRPRGPASRSSPPVSDLDSLLVVVDTVNTALGSGGRIHLESLPVESPRDVRQVRTVSSR